jgi:hypothetical protein
VYLLSWLVLDPPKLSSKQNDQVADESSEFVTDEPNTYLQE